MGARLVSGAVVYAFPKLEGHHASRAALTVMCLTAMDADDPPRYWAGPEHLALTMGLSEDPQARDAAIRRALAPLLAHGFVQRAPRASRNHRFEYLIKVHPASLSEARA